MNLLNKFLLCKRYKLNHNWDTGHTVWAVLVTPENVDKVTDLIGGYRGMFLNYIEEGVHQNIDMKFGHKPEIGRYIVFNNFFRGFFHDYPQDVFEEGFGK